MENTNNFKESLIVLMAVTIVSLFLFLINFQPEKKQSLRGQPKAKAIEKTIVTKEQEINNYFKEVINEKAIIHKLEKSISLHFAQLSLAKTQKDTFEIVQIQDTVIYTLLDQNTSLKTAVKYQDSAILAQRFIINSKDTLISLQKIDLKKIKRQRNWSFLLNGILAGVILIK